MARTYWLTVECMTCDTLIDDVLLEDWPTLRPELEGKGWRFPYPQPPIVQTPATAYKAGFCPGCGPGQPSSDDFGLENEAYI